MREDVFRKYYAAMVKIITYEETDKDGNVRKCTVPVEEAKKNPDRYKIYEFKHPSINNQSMAYDPEIVKKFTNTFRKLCAMLPQQKSGVIYNIFQKDLLNADRHTYKRLQELCVAETFFVMATECNVMRYVGQDKIHPGVVCGGINGVIPTTYKEDDKSLEPV